MVLQEPKGGQGLMVIKELLEQLAAAQVYKVLQVSQE